MSAVQTRMRELPQSTVRLLGSTQVITSVYSVVKELVENSLDAGATSLDVRLENYGLDKIEVRDNGHGIPASDIGFVAKRYHTSKLSMFSDLEKLTTYGFRGEALGSLCTVATVSITTKTKDAEVGMTYTIGKEGEIISSKPSHLTRGTTVTALNLFRSLPVRRQIYNNVKKKKEELRKVETLLISFGLICPQVRITLRHDKDLLWQKNPLPDIKASVTEVFGKNVLNQMEYRNFTGSDPEICVEMFVPRSNSNCQVTSRSTNDRCFVFVNARPVILKDLEKLMKRYYSLTHTFEGTRYPLCCILIVLPSGEIDVNIDPNKNRVFLHHQVCVATTIEKLLEDVYGPMESSDTNKKTKANSDWSDEPVPTKQLTNHVDVSLPMADLDDSFTKIIAVDGFNSGISDGQIPVFKVTTVTQNTCQSNDNKWSEEISDQDLMSNSLVNDSSKVTDKIVKTTDVSTKDLMSVSDRITETPSVERLNNQGKVIKTKEADDLQGNFDILDDSYSEVLSVDDGSKQICESVIHTSCAETETSLFHDTLKDLDDISHDANTTKDPKGSSSAVTPSGELWSKGQSLTGDGNKAIEPVALLSACKRPLTSPADDQLPPNKRRNTLLVEESQPTLPDMVSGHPVQKSNIATGYTAFIKENRPQVVSDNPNANFDEVTSLLKKKWEELTQDERGKYDHPRSEWSGCESPARSEVTSTKKVKQLSKKMKQKHNSVPVGVSIKEQLLMAAQKSKSVKDKVVPFSVKDLRQMFTGQINTSQCPKAQRLKLVGRVKSCGIWICCFDNKICILNCHRVQETVLYHQLMSDHVLSATPQEQALRLTPQNIGGLNHWKCLMSLETNRYPGDIHSYITDERIVDNGFKIRCYKDKETGSLQADIVAMTTFIPTYGIPDLAEILELICSTGAENVSQTRPLKVLNYLQGEAVRMARKLPQQQEKEEVLELLNQMDSILPAGCHVCLHNRQFCHPLYDMDSLPQTQIPVSQELLSTK